MGLIEDIPRLSPTMASRKNQAMLFIRAYFATHHAGPSISELAAALATSRSRAAALIGKLESEGRIHRVRGQARSIRPVEALDEALRQLKAEGWTINPGRLELAHPQALPVLDIVESGTNATLLADLARAHDAPDDGGRERGDRGGRRGQGTI